MAAEVTVTLPDQLYQRVQSLAQIKHRQVPEAIIEHLEATLPMTEDAPSAAELQQPHDVALAREEAAYIKLHPTLKLTHLGRYVAIYQGKLIDVDDEFGTLVERVRSQLPNQVVWMTQVKEELLQTIIKRGNRLLPIGG